MITNDNAPPPRGRGQDIVIGGKIWRHHDRIAIEDIGFSSRTLARKNPKSVLISNMTYCPVEEVLADLVAGAVRKNQPEQPKRKRSR
jgi:hypothetical protein